MRTCVRSLLTMVILGGCGSQQTLPEQPQITVSPGSILFRSDLGASFIVGVMPYGTDGVVVTDEGQNPLTISKVTLSGDSAFSLVQPTPAAPDCDGGATCQKLTINRPPDSALIILQFAPTAAGVAARDGGIFNGTLTIESDGANDGGTVVIPVSARGVVFDAG